MGYCNLFLGMYFEAHPSIFGMKLILKMANEDGVRLYNAWLEVNRPCWTLQLPKSVLSCATIILNCIGVYMQ